MTNIIYIITNRILFIFSVQSLSISDSLFGGYSFGGAPTPPPGSPYSPLRLELLSKTLSSSTTSSCITTATAAANDSACWMEPLQVKTELPGCSRTTPAHTALLQVGHVKVQYNISINIYVVLTKFIYIILFIIFLLLEKC